MSVSPASRGPRAPDVPRDPAAAGGERDAEVFAALYEQLRRFAAVLSPLTVDPDDLLQEAVARTLAKGPLHHLDNPGAYLRVAMKNLASDQYRRAAVAVAKAPRPEIACVDDYPSDLRLLEQLDPVDRAALALVVLDGQSYWEAAATLGLSVPALRSRLMRAKRILRRLYAQHDRDGEGGAM